MPRPRPLPSAKRLHELLLYDPVTGWLTWANPSPLRRSKRAGGVIRKGKYRRIVLPEGHFLEHRVIWKMMTGDDPGEALVDHENGVGTDNRWDNLRKGDEAFNMQNLKKAFKTNQSTGLLGAYKDKKSPRFYAMIALGDSKKYLGTFDTAQEAHEAYVAAKRELHPGNTL